MAEVISISLAMNRLRARQRAQRREVARAEADDRARARWLADLETWPKRFRDVIEPELLDPKCDLAAIAAARSGEQQCPFFGGGPTPADEIVGRLKNYRGHIRSIREAGSKGWRTQHRRRLRKQADALVEALWMYGFRKVDAEMRSELERRWRRCE